MARDVRIPLEKRTQITINGSVFTIGDVIGRGGLSLVYSASKEGGTTECVVKEFYPAPDFLGSTYAERDENGYVCCVDERFKKQYRDMKKLFEAEGPIGGDSAKISFQILPFWEHQNGYAVMKKESADMRSLKTLVCEWEKEAPLLPSGNPRENDQVFNNMVRLDYALKVVDSLLSALSAVHEKNYIHLDLSSSNVIWACREQTGRNGCAVLTDFGSAAVLDRCGKFRPNYRLFRSLGFAAPEIFDLNPVLTRKTDLYAVGMLLIYLCIGEERFMNRFSRIKRPAVLGRDIASIDLPLLKNTGAKLNEFLQTALVKREYDTAQEMQGGLRKLRRFTYFYLTDRESAVTAVGDKIQDGVDDKHYITRKEIKDIETILNSNQSPLFVTGIGGIGKTTLVGRFAKEYADKYFVSFVTFAGSFRNTIASLGARDFDREEWEKMPLDERFDAGLNMLKSASSNHVLIIDNADTGSYDLRADPDFHYLKEVSMGFIITTRNEMEGTGVLPLDRMCDSDCLKLMKSYLEEYENGQYDKTLLEIIDKVDGHTLTCSLLALTLRDSFKLKPADVLAALENSELDDKRWRTVKSEYNLDFIPRTVLAHLQTAFNLSELSDEIKKILGCFCLAEHGLTKECIERVFSEVEWEAIQEATSRGWLMCKEERIQDKRYAQFQDGENDYYSELAGCSAPEPNNVTHARTVYILHPVIRAVCLYDQNTKPMWKRNKEIIRKFAIVFFDGFNDRVWDKYGEKYQQILQNIERVNDYCLMEKEEPECACLICLALLDLYNLLLFRKHDIETETSFLNHQQCLVRICKSLEHNSPLFYVALEAIRKFMVVSHTQEQLLAIMRSHMMLSIDSMQNSEYSKCFFAHVNDEVSGGSSLLHVLSGIGMNYILSKDYRRAFTELEIYIDKEKEFLTVMLNNFYDLQTLIISALHSEHMREALLLAKEVVYALEKDFYLKNWALNLKLHTEDEYNWIRSKWESGEILKIYSSAWVDYRNWILHTKGNVKLQDSKIVMNSLSEHVKEVFLRVVLMCVIGYHIAIKEENDALAVEFKEKYLYYCSLLQSHYSGKTEDECRIFELLKQMYENPFTLPVIDDSFFEDIGIRTNSTLDSYNLDMLQLPN